MKMYKKEDVVKAVDKLIEQGHISLDNRDAAIAELAKTNGVDLGNESTPKENDSKPDVEGMITIDLKGDIKEQIQKGLTAVGLSDGDITHEIVGKILQDIRDDEDCDDNSEDEMCPECGKYIDDCVCDEESEESSENYNEQRDAILKRASQDGHYIIGVDVINDKGNLEIHPLVLPGYNGEKLALAYATTVIELNEKFGHIQDSMCGHKTSIMNLKEDIAKNMLADFANVLNELEHNARSMAAILSSNKSLLVNNTDIEERFEKEIISSLIGTSSGFSI